MVARIEDLMTPEKFIDKWTRSKLKETSASQEQFIDLCNLLDEPTPAEADSEGEYYCFERGARKEGGGDGWADVWKRHHFAWEYKGKHKNLEKALVQLRQYISALENPPLLIVSDMERFRIHTNWTNSVSETYEFQLKDFVDSTTREKFKWAFSDPNRLRPGETRQALTKQAAETFASLAQGLRERGYNPQTVAHFVNRLIFCMFAEDIGLLPDDMFTDMLKRVRHQPEEFVEWVGDLFRAMESGGRVGFEQVAWFNGGLFNDDTALPMTRLDIEKVLKAAILDWSGIDPSIFGTLFERGLDPDKRSQLGAHYTDPDKIMRIINPVIYHPWVDEWEAAKAEIRNCLEKAEKTDKKSGKTWHERQARRLLNQFLKRLREFTVLDPACGSGNFLYLALHALKDFEHQVQIEAEGMGFPRTFPAVGPGNVKGIEINPYAAELARLSVWIGDIQWMRRNGFLVGADGGRKPILKPLETIECRDAILIPDNEEPEWPKADVVIGNPPFLGNRKIRSELGYDYAEALPRAYAGLVRGKKPDLVCYWFAKAGQLLANRDIRSFGLVATNSIRGGTNRAVLDSILEDSIIFDAWSNEPWVVDGANVRVSLICCAPKDSGFPISLNAIREPNINSDLTAGTLDLTRTSPLKQNRGVAFQGDIKRGPFDISGDIAREWLRLPANPNGRPNADVLKPWMNGMDITRRSKDKWIVDFGDMMSETEAALYEAPFSYITEHVKPVRQKNQEKASREFWFRHWNPRPAMWRAVGDMARYVATPTVAKHRLFVWLDARICPDHQLIVIARDDDTTLGILHSRFHEGWSLRLGTSLEDRPRYTPTTTFETFPFPDGLTPDIPAADYANDPRAVAIAEAARRLVELRDRWLNPPEWVKWVDEPVPSYPRHPIPRNESSAKELKKRTLTNLYNFSPQWLLNAHADIDTAVADAYGWPNDISDDEILGRLLRLNLLRGS